MEGLREGHGGSPSVSPGIFGERVWGVYRLSLGDGGRSGEWPWADRGKQAVTVTLQLHHRLGVCVLLPPLPF